MRSLQGSSSDLLFLLTGALLTLLSPFSPESVRAQSESTVTADSAESFQYEVTGQFSGTQSAFKDWQEGGLNSLSFTAGINGTAEQESGRWTQRHDLRLGFGLLTSEADEADEPIRKAEDRIRVESNLRYEGEGFFRRFEPTISARLRTQFAKGFDYTDNPFPAGHPFAGQETPVQTSEFFAPAFLTETLGLTYAPKEWYTVRLSAASKQTVVRDERLGTLYDIDPGEQIRVEGGAELAGTIDREIFSNVRYKSSASIFLSVGQIENPPDVVWENYFIMQVNSWLTTNLEVTALFDENTTDAIQLKEVLSLGVTVDLI
jgi:hypothetical protein